MSTPQDPHPDPPRAAGARHDPLDGRLMRLEEHVAFTEHTVEQLSQEIIDLNKRLAETTRRLALLESRLGKVLAATEEPRPEFPAPPGK